MIHDVYVAIIFDLLLYAMWAGIAYAFVACGRKSSHQMATWGIVLVGGIVACQKVMSSFVGAAFTNTMKAFLSTQIFPFRVQGLRLFRCCSSQ
ncbi:hypothetical protein BS297_20690 [Rhodococcus erythropolis]|uniref:Uncharacterized protein n=1 Tax=Rhodococcus erythropolis TaxID=1833 RepID=A0A5N5E5W1_RHOER|nr:hypothetical protein BS297_20690 [Rhodococcus erythropolis]